jgi:uncharacterized membrane protein
LKQSSSHLQDHIEIVAKHEQEFLKQRTSSERIGDSLGAFIGSLTFVIIQLCGFAAWVLTNTLRIGRFPHFDPFPFPLLDGMLALEAILLASFIVMRQSRISPRAEEREHLILQMLLLTEKEITAVLGLDRQIAARVGLTEVATDNELEQLSQDTSIDEVAQTLKEQLPND